MRIAVVGHLEWVELLRVVTFPAPGEVVEASEVARGPGGATVGVALQLRRLGCAVSLFTRTSADELAQDAVRLLRHRFAIVVEQRHGFGPDALQAQDLEQRFGKHLQELLSNFAGAGGGNVADTHGEVLANARPTAQSGLAEAGRAAELDPAIPGREIRQDHVGQARLVAQRRAGPLRGRLGLAGQEPFVG